MDREMMARMLQGGNAVGGRPSYPGIGTPPRQPPVIVQATPPQLPPFQIPGMNTLAGLGFPQGTSPQVPTPNSIQQTPPPASAPMPQAGGGVQPIQDMGVVNPAPGMAMQVPQDQGFLAAIAKMLQSSPDTPDWRKRMDAAQFARQGQ